MALQDSTYHSSDHFIFLLILDHFQVLYSPQKSQLLFMNERHVYLVYHDHPWPIDVYVCVCIMFCVHEHHFVFDLGG